MNLLPLNTFDIAQETVETVCNAALGSSGDNQFGHSLCRYHFQGEGIQHLIGTGAVSGDGQVVKASIQRLPKED